MSFPNIHYHAPRPQHRGSRLPRLTVLERLRRLVPQSRVRRAEATRGDAPYKGNLRKVMRRSVSAYGALDGGGGGGSSGGGGGKREFVEKTEEQGQQHDKVEQAAREVEEGNDARSEDELSQGLEESKTEGREEVEEEIQEDDGDDDERQRSARRVLSAPVGSTGLPRSQEAENEVGMSAMSPKSIRARIEQICCGKGIKELREKLVVAENKAEVLNCQKSHLEKRLQDVRQECRALREQVKALQQESRASYMERTFLQKDVEKAIKERDAWYQRSLYLEQVSKAANIDRNNAVTELNRRERLQEEILREKIRAQEEIKSLRSNFNKLMMKALSTSLDIDFSDFEQTTSPRSVAPPDLYETNSCKSDASTETESTTALLKSEIEQLQLQVERGRQDSRSTSLQCHRLQDLLKREKELVANYREDCSMLRQQVVAFAARHEKMTKELSVLKTSQASTATPRSLPKARPEMLQQTLRFEHGRVENTVLKDESRDYGNIIS